MKIALRSVFDFYFKNFRVQQVFVLSQCKTTLAYHTFLFEHLFVLLGSKDFFFLILKKLQICMLVWIHFCSHCKKKTWKHKKHVMSAWELHSHFSPIHFSHWPTLRSVTPTNINVVTPLNIKHDWTPYLQCILRP